MNKKHVIGYAATAFVALGIGAAGASSSPGGGGSASPSTPAAQTITLPAPAAETVTTTVTATQAAAPRATQPATTYPGDGTYEVGVDIPAGTYVSDTPDSGNCYWARLKGSDGLGSIIDNNNSAGRSVVTIKKTDKFFESSGCNDWVRR